MSEHDVLYAFGYILTGIFVVGAFSMGLQGVAWGAAQKCASGDATCSWLKEAATRFKLMLQLTLGEGDLAKGVRGNFQVVVLVAILLVLIGQWRTSTAAKSAPKPCVLFSLPSKQKNWAWGNCCCLYFLAPSPTTLSFSHPRFTPIQ